MSTNPFRTPLRAVSQLIRSSLPSRQPPATVTPSNSTNYYNRIAPEDSSESSVESNREFVFDATDAFEESEIEQGPFDPIDDHIIGLNVDITLPITVNHQPEHVRPTAGNNDNFCWTHTSQNNHRSPRCRTNNDDSSTSSASSTDSNSTTSNMGKEFPSKKFDVLMRGAIIDANKSDVQTV